MNQNSFYLAMVGGMLAIIIALGFNAYANWTAVECTSVYFIEKTDTLGGLAPTPGFSTEGMVHHTCFDRDGQIVVVDQGLITRQPRTPQPE